MVVEHAHVSDRGVVTAHHRVDSGVDAKAGRVARLDEGGQIVERRGPFHPAVPAVHPGGALQAGRRHGRVEQDIAARGTDIQDDIGESHCRDAFAVLGNVSGVIGIKGEIRSGIDPYIARLSLDVGKTGRIPAFFSAAGLAVIPFIPPFVPRFLRGTGGEEQEGTQYV